MLRSDFSFSLPDSLIATHAVTPRDRARLLNVSTQPFQDLHVYDLPSLLKSGDLLVFNDTSVIPARLFAKRGEARVEVMLHKMLFASENMLRWRAFVRPARKVKIGDVLNFSDDFSATVIERLDAEAVLEFSMSRDAFFAQLQRFGEMPLPPYITRMRALQVDDNARYQTIYAKHPGAVAAPTAGLHFTDELFQALADKGVETAFVTLHVGAGTFLPMKAERVADHVMHAEYGVINAEVASKINQAKRENRRVIAVGTTSARLLESAADEKNHVRAFADETAIFMYPGYEWKIVDGLFTNFHLPESTLFMLVSAFCGLERMKRAYAHAIEQAYRFYSYGDACFLLRQEDA